MVNQDPPDSEKTLSGKRNQDCGGLIRKEETGRRCIDRNRELEARMSSASPSKREHNFFSRSWMIWNRPETNFSVSSHHLRTTSQARNTFLISRIFFGPSLNLDQMK